MTSSAIPLTILAISSVFFAAMAFHWARRYFSAREEIARLAASQIDIDALAAKALKGNSDSFMELAKLDQENRHLQLDKLLQPIKHSLTVYQDQLKELEQERKKSYFQVESELKRVIQANESLTRETTSLKNVLKRPHVRGRWGEVQLRNCIELAGMSEYSDFTIQDFHTADEQRHIPDLTVRMPGGRLIVVDAKTPIEAFIASLEAADDATRQTELLRHGKHVKDHVKRLSTRAYAEVIKDSPDFTVMFLPNESFLYAALETQPDLVEYALQKKVLVATPPTLIGLLKVIRYGWTEERLAENATRISEAGAELHKRLCDFVEAYVNVGKHLEKAKSEYDSGLSRLQSRVIVQAERLEKLGAKSNKELSLSSMPIENQLTSSVPAE